MPLIPLELCKKVEIKNSNNETRIIGYNYNDKLISCYYIKDRRLYYAGDVAGYSMAKEWLNGKNIDLLR